MKIRVVSEFYDKFHTSTLFKVGTVLDFDDARALDVINRNLAEAVVEEPKKADTPKPEPEKVEENPKNVEQPETKVEEVTEENPEVTEETKVEEEQKEAEAEKVENPAEEAQKSEEKPTVRRRRSRV